MQTQLIVALDNISEDQALPIAKELSSAGVEWFKVGLELYTKSGPRLVENLKSQGFKVFLDLKLYDIPNTMAQAVRAAASLGADFLTVHCSAGADALIESQKACAGSTLKLLGVTVLTSFDDASFSSLLETLTTKPISDFKRQKTVASLAQLAFKSGLPGVVCSVPDLLALSAIQNEVSGKFFVTPGIRPSGGSANDQKSIATPEEATRLGSTHIVVGRPILSPAQGSRT